MAFASQAARTPVHRAFTSVPEEHLCPPYDMRDEFTWIDFSGIESPHGTPASFKEAMKHAIGADCVRLKPDREAHALRSILARGMGLPADSFLVGSTVTEMLRTVAQAYEPCTVGVSVPCRPEYVLAVANAGHAVEPIAAPSGFAAPDAQTLAERGVHVDAVVLGNPSYPASRLLSRSTLVSYLETCAWVVVDERSIELTLGGESMAGLTRDYDNLVVVQSFSEQYALQGTPISYCIAQPGTIRELARFYDNSCVSMFAEVLAEPSALERFRLDDIREFLYSEIPWMQCMLSLVPGIDIFPAEANYVMCRYRNGGEMKLAVDTVDQLSAQLQLEGFLVRKLAGMPGVPDDGYFCVAVRTHEENEKLVRALRGIICPRL